MSPAGRHAVWEQPHELAEADGLPPPRSRRSGSILGAKVLPSAMDPNTNPDLQQRLQQLMREVETPVAAPRSQVPARSQPNARWLPRIPMVAGVGMALALILGIQLGALPWRYRRELWQAQGAAFGMVVGLAIGRFSARRSGGGL